MLRSVTLVHFECGRTLCRLAGLSALSALLAVPALSQPAGNAPPSRPGPDVPTARPADNAPAGQPRGDGGGQRPPVGRQGEPSEQPGPGAVRRRQAPEVDPGTLPQEVLEQPSGPTLPPDFTPPAPTPEVMTLRKPLMTQEEITEEDKDLRRVPPRGADYVLVLGDPTAANKEVVQRWADLQIARLTAVDEWSKLDGITTEIFLKLRTAANRQSNPNRELEFRRALCEALTKACTNVLDNNFYVRMAAVRILGQLNEREEPPVGTPKPPVSYVPAMKPLLEVLKNPEQPEAVKVLATVGIARISEYAELIDAELKYAAADVLIAELARKDTFWWYQMRLAEAHAALKFDLDRNRQPAVINSLLATIADNSRPCHARAAAARALGRTPIPAGQFDDKAAADRLVQLARDMSLDFNKAPAGIKWLYCYRDLYLTFKPEAGEDVSRIPASALLRKGTLPQPLADAEERIRPIVEHVFNQPLRGDRAPIPTEMVQRLNEVLAVAGQN